MQSNNLHSFSANQNSISIHNHQGFTVDYITAGLVAFRGNDTLRPVELRHLADIAEDFSRFHHATLAHAGNEQCFMPILNA